MTIIKLLCQIWLAFIFITDIYAQCNYPLQTGNTWEYRDLYDNTYQYTTRAICDTIMPNGTTYTFLWSKRDTTTMYLQFFRQSGSRVYYYSIYEQKEYLWYDFSKQTGDTVSINYYDGDTTIIVVIYERTQNIFGNMRRQWGFYEKSFVTSLDAIREVTDSLGLTFDEGIDADLFNYLSGAVINGVRYGTITHAEYLSPNIPDDCMLYQNYPNPFNPSTTIEFVVEEYGNASLRVYDILGREVSELLNKKISPGKYKVKWNAEKLSSGVYFYKLRVGEFSKTKKMLLLR